MLVKSIKYSLNDISIVQNATSSVSSRTECNPYYEDGFLPLFTAPMASVVGLENYQLFEQNKIRPILPRTVDLFDRKVLCGEMWCAFSLKEFISFANKNTLLISSNKKLYILIDIANGNMIKLHDAIKSAKEAFGDNMQIMAGNVANPDAYVALSDAGADYVRIGIGTGSVCITSSNTGVHYPMASLIDECHTASLNLKNPAKIIADGGIKGYADITKALALGADYVMCGSIFNKMLESSGITRFKRHDESEMQMKLNPFNEVNQYSSESLDYFNNGAELIKVHYGMSTKRAQKEMGVENLRTSEGIEKTQPVEYTMVGWTDNCTQYIKSAMSYTGKTELTEYVGEVDTIIVSNNSYNSINR